MDAEKIFWVAAVALAGGFFLFLLFGGAANVVSAAPQAGSLGNPPLASGGSLPEIKNGIQEITLTVQGANYMPNPIRVKKGVPVRITADLSSVRGCASSIVIPDFGVRKTFRQGDNSVEFTPDKSGTFDFGCSMWMYTGKIVVEEADGTVAATVSANAAPSASAGGCKMGGGGGCGCGGAV